MRRIMVLKTLTFLLRISPWPYMPSRPLASQLFSLASQGPLFAFPFLWRTSDLFVPISDLVDFRDVV